MKYERCLEKFSAVISFEFCDTLSHASRSIIGTLRCIEHRDDPTTSIAYALIALSGIFSAIHGVIMPRQLFGFHWIPVIAFGLYSMYKMPVMTILTLPELVLVDLAIIALLYSHVYPPGYAMLHLLASLVVDIFVQDMRILKAWSGFQ